MSETKNKILWIVIAVWLAGSAYGFWFFQLRYQHPFVSPARATLFESGAEAPAAEVWFRTKLAAQDLPGRATVGHVYDKDCPCNRFTDPHLARIESRYASQVRFLRIERTSTIGVSGPPWIEALPAALVFNAQGKLLYFGPYSETASCGTSNGLVERVLDQMLAGRNPQPQLVISGGCFCVRKPRSVMGIKL